MATVDFYPAPIVPTPTLVKIELSYEEADGLMQLLFCGTGKETIDRLHLNELLDLLRTRLDNKRLSFDRIANLAAYPK